MFCCVNLGAEGTQTEFFPSVLSCHPCEQLHAYSSCMRVPHVVWQALPQVGKQASKRMDRAMAILRARRPGKLLSFAYRRILP